MGLIVVVFLYLFLGGAAQYVFDFGPFKKIVNNKVNEYPEYDGIKKSIAVIDIKALSVSEITAEILSESIRDELFKTGHFRIMERSEMDNIFQEQSFSFSGFVDDTDSMVRIGKVLMVQEIVSGSISKLGDMYSLSLKIVNVETSEIENSANVRKILKEEDLFELVHEGVLKLVQ